jgi:ribose transport system permease protein
MKQSNNVQLEAQSLSQLSFKRIYSNYATQFNTILALIGLGAILTFTVPDFRFLTSDNLISVLLQSSINSILAIAETFIIITGGIDLAVGATVALTSSMMGALVINYGLNPFLGILAAILIGLCAGYIHGLLIAKINIPPFIVTLGTMTIWRGVALQFMNGTNIFGLPKTLNWFGQAYFGPIPVAVIFAVFLYFCAWFVLSRTKLGTYVYAIGGNETASRLSGINIDRIKIIVYSISGFLCAIAGILVAGRINAASPNTGNGYELDAIAAVVIGGTSFSGGQGLIWGTLIGAIMMGVIRNGLNMLNVSPYYQMIVIGLVIIVAVGLDCFRRKVK